MKNYLSIKLLNGLYEAILFKGGKPHTKSFKVDTPISSLDELKEILEVTIQKFNYKGKQISFLYEGDKMTHSFVQAPHMAEKDLILFLNRKAQQEKECKGEAIFSYSRTSSPKGGGDIILLKIIDKDFVENLNKICNELGLYPQRLIPPSTVLARQMESVQAEKKNDMVAFLAELGDLLSVVIATPDRSVIFNRYFQYEWKKEEDITRVGREINRSILFSKQQFGIGVSTVIPVGDFTESFLQKIQGQLEGVTMQTDVLWHKPHFWLSGAHNVPIDHSTNLLPKKLRNFLKRRRYIRITSSLLAVLWIVSISSVAFIESVIFSQKQDLTKNSGTINRLKSEKVKWDKKHQQLESIISTNKFLQTEMSPPVPGYFLGYIGEVLPDELIINNLEIQYRDRGWDVTISGVSLNGQKETADDLSKFEKSIQSGSFNVSIVQSWRAKWLVQLKKGAATEDTHLEFLIKGRMH